MTNFSPDHYHSTEPDMDLFKEQEDIGGLQAVPESEPYEYRLLKGHQRTDGSYKTGEQLRTDYLQRSDELIRLMTDGIEVTDPTGQHTSVEVPDDVVFLDKSARPLAWMVREMWDEYAPEPGGPVPNKPDMYFANIDRLQWINDVDPEGVGAVDVENIAPGVVRSLRSVYVAPKHKRLHEDGTGGLDEAIDEAPADLDGKTVLIIDEVNSSGRTLKIAEKMYGRAFPTARIAGAHWMGGVASRGGATGNADLPVWYKEDTVYGRGIGNRSPGYAESSKNITQKLGGWFLGTPLQKVEIDAPTEDDPYATEFVIDPASTQLRGELAHLPHDPNVLKLPSMMRDDFEERAVALNNMPFEEVVAWKQQQDRDAKDAQGQLSRRRR